MGAPRWPPSPPTLGAPRRSRDAPLDRASPEMVPLRLCFPAVAGEAEAVVGVAEGGRERGAVPDGAPRVGVTPRAAPTDPPRPGLGPARVGGRRARVVVVVVPVGTPLVTDAGEV